MSNRCLARLTKVAAMLVSTLIASLSFAAEYSRDVTILKLHPVAAVRPYNPPTQNLIRIYVNTGAWGSSSCRTDAADLRVEDWHLQSILLTAWKSAMPIKIYVEDSLRPVAGDTVCQVTALMVG